MNEKSTAAPAAFPTWRCTRPRMQSIGDEAEGLSYVPCGGKLAYKALIDDETGRLDAIGECDSCGGLHVSLCPNCGHLLMTWAGRGCVSCDSCKRRYHLFLEHMPAECPECSKLLAIATTESAEVSGKCNACGYQARSVRCGALGCNGRRVMTAMILGLMPCCGQCGACSARWRGK